MEIKVKFEQFVSLKFNKTRVSENNDPEKKEKPTDIMMDKAADTFNWWNKMATLQEDDPIYIGFFKIMLRVIGIAFMIAISPLVILGLVVAFTAAF